MKKAKKYIYPFIFSIWFYILFRTLYMVILEFYNNYGGLGLALLFIILWILVATPIFCFKYSKLIYDEKRKFLFIIYNPLVISLCHTGPFLISAIPGNDADIIIKITLALFVWIAFCTCVSYFIRTNDTKVPVENTLGETRIILITGASHTGKTALAQNLLEKYKYPYLSIDHLKMGLIRSGNTTLTPLDDDKLTEYLWPIVREMVKTAIENKQNLIVEGCYIPFDWANDFEKEYLEQIKYYCLILSESYIKNNFADIKKFANVIENRLDDEWCTMESVLADNAEVLSLAKKHNVNYVLIEDKYEINVD